MNHEYIGRALAVGVLLLLALADLLHLVKVYRQPSVKDNKPKGKQND